MLTKFDADDPLDALFRLCREHAMVEGAFSERLTRQWFDACFALCAAHIGLVYPAVKIDETVAVDQEYGTLALTYKPTSPVQLYSGIRPVAVLPPNSPCITGEAGCPELCCHCWLRAIYTVGTDLQCGVLPARFSQAVMQLFSYLVENRGDVRLGPDVLSASGALGFLAPDLCYVA